jgi:hypothetical protein
VEHSSAALQRSRFPPGLVAVVAGATRLKQVPVYIQRSMKDTQDVNVIVCDNIGNSVMAIQENTDVSFRFFAIFMAKLREIA